MSRETPLKTVTVAFLLCVVCSVLVSTAALLLRPRQNENRERDVKKNILTVSGLLKNGEVEKEEDIDKLFSSFIEPLSIDFASGKRIAIAAPTSTTDLSPSVKIPKNKDVANIHRRAKQAKVYLVRKGGVLTQIILPIHGKGLWSTMYGFISLKGDASTVEGFTFYSHGETPGLGGEVDNPRWKKKWKGKRLFTPSSNVSFRVAKGAVDPRDPRAIHQIDGLSGATITSKGVENTIHYWFGDHGFGPFLTRVRAGEF